MSSLDQRTSSAAKSTPATPQRSAPAPDAQDQLGNAAIQEQLSESQASPGQLTWEAALGELVGGELYGAIADQIDDESLIDVAGSAVGSATEALDDWLAGQVSPDDTQAAQVFVQALDLELQRIASQAITDGLGDALRGVVDDNPYAVSAAIAAAAVAYVMTNQDLPMMSSKVKLGGGHSLIGGVDLGRTLDLALEQVRVGYRYSSGGNTAQITGDQYLQEGGWAVQGRYERALSQDERLTLSGQHVERPGENRSRLDLGYATDALTAAAYWERMRGERTVDAVGGSVTAHQDDMAAYLRGEARSDGSWTSAAGVSKTQDDMSWGVEGFAGQDAQGRDDHGVRALFKWRF